MVNTEKSEAICFTRKSMSRCESLFLEERPVTWKETVKYLGVQLDRRLCFNAHVTETLDDARDVRSSAHESYYLPFVSHVGTDLCGALMVVTSVNHQQV